MRQTLGGRRVQGGKKMQVDLHEFGWSPHNLGNIIKTDQACGTIVPYRCDIALNGGVMEYNIRTKVRTLPTQGPLFGSFKHQIDAFQIPFRLYIAVLHNNALKIGLNMKKAILPQYKIRVPTITEDIHESGQFSTSSLLNYLGHAGVGTKTEAVTERIEVTFPGMFYLAYWDIYKNYYANKQEEEGVYIGPAEYETRLVDYLDPNETAPTIKTIGTDGKWNLPPDVQTQIIKGTLLNFRDKNGKYIDVIENDTLINTGRMPKRATEILEYAEGNNTYGLPFRVKATFGVTQGATIQTGKPNDIELRRFKLEEIDNQREKILAAPKGSAYQLNDTDQRSADIFASDRYVNAAGDYAPNSISPQCGLAIKCYLSDRFNNWLNTEWIEGENGVNDLTAIDVSSGVLKINTLILQKKMFNMMNRIAVSDGTYKAWQEAVYGERAERIVESPIYEGGFSSEIVFEEVVGTAATNVNGNNSPLGALAGRGTDYNSKGGKFKIKAKEPTMIMILGSITPRIGYSQGNKWWTRLKTIDDLHKPNLDGIGFQDLITDEMAAWDTTRATTGDKMYSAGKQVSWQEYMTDEDRNYGSFAAGESLGFMALNRNYERDIETGHIKDLTTYIDPKKFNYAFADTKLTAMNFWVQVAIDCTARRKMSAKQIPNL